MTNTINLIKEELDLEIQSIEQVQGGDIAHAYKIKVFNGKTYFLKYLSGSQSIFESEVDGLRRLKKATHDFIIPHVIFLSSNPNFLLLEWIDMNNKASDVNYERDAGISLAKLHQNYAPDGLFGLDRDNHIGLMPQLNTQKEEWIQFYYEYRGLKLLIKGSEMGLFTIAELKLWDQLVKKYSEECPQPKKASLIHGDLWTGNMSYHSMNGKSIVYDPAIYYGNPEMDLAMTNLFGGFSYEFYDAYESYSSIDSDWRKRLEFHQFYPLLVHAIMFKGHYVDQIKSLLRKYK